MLVDESMRQFQRSKFRADFLEVIAYVVSVLTIGAALVTLAYGIRDEDRDSILVAIPIFIIGIASFLVISASAQLLSNSAHQLRLAAYDFLLSHDDDDDDDDDW